VDHLTWLLVSWHNETDFSDAILYDPLQSSFGREVSTPAGMSVRTKRLDTTPLASFIFRYREHSGFIRVPRLWLRFLTRSTQVFSVPTG